MKYDHPFNDPNHPLHGHGPVLPPIPEGTKPQLFKCPNCKNKFFECEPPNTEIHICDKCGNLAFNPLYKKEK